MKIKRDPVAKQQLEPLAIYPEVRDYVLFKLKQLGTKGVMSLIEDCASCAIEGNKVGEQIAVTLNRIIQQLSVGDRYVMQLAWFLRDLDEEPIICKEEELCER